LDRAPATGHDNDVHLTSLVEIANPVRNIERRRISLHLDGKNQHIGRSMTAVENVEDIPERGSLRRRDNANSARKGGDVLLSCLIEQAFGLQLGLELFKSDLQRARASRLQVFGQNLQFTTLFVNRHATASNHLHAVFGPKT